MDPSKCVALRPLRVPLSSIPRIRPPTSSHGSLPPGAAQSSALRGTGAKALGRECGADTEGDRPVISPSHSTSRHGDDTDTRGSITARAVYESVYCISTIADQKWMHRQRVHHAAKRWGDGTKTWRAIVAQPLSTPFCIRESAATRTRLPHHAIVTYRVQWSI